MPRDTTTGKPSTDDATAGTLPTATVAPPVPVRSLRCVAAVAAGLVLCAPSAAMAAEGARNACPWQQDLSLAIGPKTLTVPQSVFNPKALQSEIDGYTLFPDVERLSLRVMTPAGDTWEAPLTVLGGKRCIAYYVGRATLVAEAYVPPVRPRRNSVAEK
ncbi:hypothetical protein [Azospirillum halopraeferens]|uniref:hypothetical protein n=1 Tax=Azospirillum halopraeferens TaxID=34010 RepID=UPI00040C6E39|nr:hypothetical protein [Azospirillum halopraeferens]